MTLLNAAVSGDARALRQVVDLLLPTIQTRVARVLYRYRSRSGQRDVAQEVEDLTQESFVTLFADDARVLRSWNPERGSSLAGWVGLVVERNVGALLRTKKRSPWTEIPTEQDRLESVTPSPVAWEQRVHDRFRLLHIAEELQQAVSPLGFHIFRRLFVDECTDEELRNELDMSSEALYVWRHRLRQRAREIAAELDARDAPTPRERK